VYICMFVCVCVCVCVCICAFVRMCVIVAEEAALKLLIGREHSCVIKIYTHVC